MSPVVIAPGDIRSAALLYRARADSFLACELYEDGRVHEALLRSTRPITDVLPWLENELRERSGPITGLTRALGALGGSIRAERSPGDVKVAARRVEKATDEVIRALVGDRADSPAFMASVLLGLVDEAEGAYRRAFANHGIDDYHLAQSALTAALDLAHSPSASSQFAGIVEALQPFMAALDDFDPPDALNDPAELVTGLGSIRDSLGRLGAEAVDSREAAIDRLERLVVGVAAAYARGDVAVASRAAAHLFIHAYDPIRESMAESHPEVESRLTEILGVRLRVLINGSAPISEIREQTELALTLLGSIRA